LYFIRREVFTVMRSDKIFVGSHLQSLEAEAVLCQIGGGFGHPSNFIIVLYVVTIQNCDSYVLL
jgi:hypothetical protein